MILKDIKLKDSDSKILMQAFHGTESPLLSLTLLLVPQKLGKAKRGPKNLQGQSQSSRTPLTLSFVFTRSWQRTTQSKNPFRRGASSLLLIDSSSRRLHTSTPSHISRWVCTVSRSSCQNSASVQVQFPGCLCFHFLAFPPPIRHCVLFI